jgi:hypothetical protein
MKKIKVGILTFHRSINYGAFFQAYSLSKKLQKDFGSMAEIEVIDFEYLKKNIWHKLIVLKRSRIKFLLKYLKQYSSFRSALKSLALSKKRFLKSGSKKTIDYINENYDIIIVGSDAVWSYNNFKLGVKNIYFLKDIKITKLSYAACAFGLDFDLLDTKENEYASNALNEFIYIGVRDLATFEYAERLTQKEISINCDPTFLLEKPSNNLIEKILKKHKLSNIKPIIGLMLDNDEISKKIKETYGHTHQIVSIFNHNKYADIFLYDLSPFEWSQVFQIFDIVFTTYFHCTILSLRNHVPVISIQGYPYNEKYISKIEQLLKDLDLNEYCFIASKLTPTEINRMFKLAENTLLNRDSIVQRIANGILEEQKKYTKFKEIFSKILNSQRI